MSARVIGRINSNPPGYLTVGAPGGVAGLDGTGKVPVDQVPDIPGSDPTALHEANNLADVDDAAAALANLGGTPLGNVVTKTASYTAARGDVVKADTTGGTFTVTIPAASGGKGRIAVKWTAGTVAPTVALSGSDHFNTSTGGTSATPALLNQGYVLESDGTSIWTVTSDDLPLSALTTYNDARYFQVTEAPLSPARYGAVGDNVTDDTVALQNFANALARASNGHGLITRDHRISDALTVGVGAFHIEGANGTPTTITQVTANKAIFKLVKDTGGGESFSRGGILANLMLIGPGSGATTAFGIDGDNSGDSTYQGQRLLLDNLRIKGFATGVQLNHWDNCEVRASVIESCLIGWYSRGNANSMRLQLATTTCTTAAIKLGDGMGVILDLMDNIAAGQILMMASGAEAKLLGGNFEDCTGAQAFFYVPSGAQLTVLGGRFAKTVGNDVNRFLMDNGGILTIAGVPHDDSTFTTKAIKTGNQPDGLTVLGNGFAGSQPPVSASELYVDHNGALTYSAETIPAREDDFAPTGVTGGSPDQRLRGRLLRLLGRDSANTQDRLVWYSQDKTSGTAQILRHRLDGRLYGTGTPAGVVAAPVGTEYIDESGTANAILYVKESGTGTSGWTAYGAIAGPAGPSGTTGRNDLRLRAAGLLAENWPLEGVETSQTPANQTTYGMLLGLQSGDVVNKLCVAVATAGAGTAPTLIKLGLMRVSTGKIVALTANEAANAAWTSGFNIAQISLTAPYTVPGDDGYVLVFLSNGVWGTTQMKLGSFAQATALSSTYSAAVGTGARRLGIYTGLTTDLPAVGAGFSGSSNTNLNFWAAAAA